MEELFAEGECEWRCQLEGAAEVVVEEEAEGLEEKKTSATAVAREATLPGTAAHMAVEVAAAVVVDTADVVVVGTDRGPLPRAVAPTPGPAPVTVAPPAIPPAAPPVVPAPALKSARFAATRKITNFSG